MHVESQPTREIAAYQELPRRLSRARFKPAILNYLFNSAMAGQVR